MYIDSTCMLYFSKPASIVCYVFLGLIYVTLCDVMFRAVC